MSPIPPYFQVSVVNQPDRLLRVPSGRDCGVHVPRDRSEMASGVAPHDRNPLDRPLSACGFYDVSKESNYAENPVVVR